MTKTKAFSPTDNLTITTHYQRSDNEFGGDYDSVDVCLRIGDDRFLFQYGDYYHDKGLEKAQGIIDLVRAIYGKKFPIQYIDTNDIKDYE